MRNCVNCGKEFKHTRQQKHCSVACRRAYTRPPPRSNIACRGCGTIIHTPVGRQLFCTESCKDAFHNAKKAHKYRVVCVACGKEFTSSWATTKYCSPTCQLKHQPVPVKELVCERCGVTFTFEGRTSAAWCPDCRHKYSRYKYYTKGYRQACYIVWDKACALCGATDGFIDVHHINGDARDINPTNLIPLCRYHHGRVHARCKRAKTQVEYIIALDAVWPEWRAAIHSKLELD